LLMQLCQWQSELEQHQGAIQTCTSLDNLRRPNSDEQRDEKISKASMDEIESAKKAASDKLAYYASLGVIQLTAAEASLPDDAVVTLQRRATEGERLNAASPIWIVAQTLRGGLLDEHLSQRRQLALSPGQYRLLVSSKDCRPQPPVPLSVTTETRAPFAIQCIPPRTGASVEQGKAGEIRAQPDAAKPEHPTPVPGAEQQCSLAWPCCGGEPLCHVARIGLVSGLVIGAVAVYMNHGVYDGLEDGSAPSKARTVKRVGSVMNVAADVLTIGGGALVGAYAFGIIGSAEAPTGAMVSASGKF
jgi:hypothetical protein